MTLGEKISNERKNRGLSQELLAEKSGVSLRTIQRIENNKSKPRPYTLKVITDTLKIDMEELISDESTISDILESNSSLTKINLINSSALLGILIPFLNIIVPVTIWKLNKENPLVNEKGKKVISFQLLWLLLSSLILLVTHVLHYNITGEFVIGRIPFVIVVYIFLLIINVFFVIKSSIQLKNGNINIYSFIPHLF